MRLVDYLENGTREIIQRMNELRVNGYDADDIGAAARDAAALWERTLKASESEWSVAKASLYEMTQKLGQRGWAHTNSLNVIRKAANADKHDASPGHEFGCIFDAIVQLADAVDELPDCVPHVIDPAPERLRRRRIVCAIYDWFAQGETEFSFLSAQPDDTWQTVHEIDSFQVSAEHSRAIEEALADFEGWAFNPPAFEILRASLRESDDEFWRLATFTASYQDVLELMAPYQHTLPLLKGLHREDHRHNVVATIVGEHIADRTSSVLTGRSSVHDQLRIQVADLLGSLPDSVNHLQLDRCNAAVFAQAVPGALVADHWLGLLVKQNGVVLVVG
ncbi:hypothetical protein [Amycolatopsis antarctica]|uniref:hypothetical protein n=1 Tax=Amycolatopsis antarctica TaxID=1854586 RepID=UPI001056A415|nr:hypothetical protein [Amycolatopsis antarctica]